MWRAIVAHKCVSMFELPFLSSTRIYAVAAPIRVGEVSATVRLAVHSVPTRAQERHLDSARQIACC